MISLSHLNKSIKLAFFFIIFFTVSVYAEEAVDIWKQKQKQNQVNEENKPESNNSIISTKIKKLTVSINENQIEDSEYGIVGLFDPEKNNFNLDMWINSNGEDIKQALKRINKLKLSETSEDLLFQVLFTNAYSPKDNLSTEEFLKIKINWLIKNKRIKDLESLLKNNPEVGKSQKAVKFLINEYISSADIKSACEKINFIDKKMQNKYLDKFIVYCLLYNDQKDEAQLIFDLLKEGGFKDNFFENKFNFLIGISDKTTQEIVDNNLLNFYLSHVTNENFQYEPNEKTDKYIWRYLSSANLIEINSFEDESIIATYEQAASENSFENDEIFKIYLKLNFNFNQLVNVREIYKSLPSYKARALVYQSILLNDEGEKKIELAFLLKDLFIKDKLLNIYSEELSDILKSIDINEVPEIYAELIKENLEEKSNKDIKFENDIFHKSKIIKHFLENNKSDARTKKDLKAVYKKIKKNKKYFISIKDIIVLESLSADGISLPNELNYNDLSSQLTIPKNLEDLVKQNQMGLVMLKVVEIIGEDKVRDLDPETLYFLNKILNILNLKKIRNIILSKALTVRV